jgi:hypothetical protein
MDFAVVRMVTSSGCRKFFNLKRGIKYPIPRSDASRRPTHIRVMAGKLSFGFSRQKGDKITRRGKFFEIPRNAGSVTFPDYTNGRKGHSYGQPKWHLK